MTERSWDVFGKCERCGHSGTPLKVFKGHYYCKTHCFRIVKRQDLAAHAQQEDERLTADWKELSNPP